MKRFIKSKKTKMLLKFLAVPALFGTIIATASYGLVSTTNNNSASKQFGLTNRDTTVANQPTINDVVNGDVSSLSQPITTSNGDFILPTLNHNKLPGLIKVNSFVAGLYGINFDNFSGYHVRQIVQNYNEQNQYFVLLVNDSTNVTASWTTDSNISFSITNPGHILSVVDSGTAFSITADYELGAPIIDSIMAAYYKGMYFQPPLASTTQQTYSWSHWDNPWSTLNPNDLAFTESKQTATSQGSGEFVYTQKTINTSSSSLKNLNQSWNGYSQNIATLLYLNSLNNMVFVSNKVNNTGSDVIYLFGGNQYINLWFYTFYVNDKAPTTTSVLEYASAYANYGFHWGTQAPGYIDPSSSSSDEVTQKAYNFRLKKGDNGPGSTSSWQYKKYKDASFFGYYVAGAKLVNEPNPQILLSLAIPNFTLANIDKPIVFTTNANFTSWSAAEQNPASFYVTYYGSISLDQAIQTTQYRQDQVAAYQTSNTWQSSSSWTPRYSNYGYTFMNYLWYYLGNTEYAVTPEANDGMASEVYNKVVAYLPQDIGGNNIALSYNRDKVQAAITTKDGISTSASAKLSLYKSDTRLNALSNISYADQTWFLWFDDTDSSGKSSTIIYFFTYDDLTSQVLFSQTNLSLGGDAEVLNILPLNQDYIYVLSRKKIGPSAGSRDNDYQVTPLLYHLSDIKGNYNQNVQYNNLITDSSVAKFDGIPAYSNNGVQNDDQKAIWGTVTFKDINYLTKAGFLSNPASFLADDPAALQTLVSYQPGWDGQDFKVSATANADNQLQLSVSIKYFNGQYFTPQQLSSQSALTQTYGGFSALPDWVLPVAIAVPILFLAIILALGLGLGIPMARTRKLQDKGFTQTFKKVDTLTSAVGSVYKKIITETSTIKKKPQMLKSASVKSIKKPEGIKPLSQAPKPVGPTTPIKQVPNSAPIGSANPNVGNTMRPKSSMPTAPIRPTVQPPHPGAPKKSMS